MELGNCWNHVMLLKTSPSVFRRQNTVETMQSENYFVYNLNLSSHPKGQAWTCLGFHFFQPYLRSIWVFYGLRNLHYASCRKNILVFIFGWRKKRKMWITKGHANICARNRNQLQVFRVPTQILNQQTFSFIFNYAPYQWVDTQCKNVMLYICSEHFTQFYDTDVALFCIPWSNTHQTHILDDHFSASMHK